MSKKTVIKPFLIKVVLYCMLIFIVSANTYAQQTIGLFTNTPESFDGYTLFAPIKNETTYLINNCGEKVHSWTSQYKPGLSCYLMENGVLLRTAKLPSGAGGIVEMIEWDGNVIWDYTINPALGKQHHDIELLPNGNILFIVSDVKSRAEVIQAGSFTSLSEIKSEQIIEVQPDLALGGGTVVWEWKTWDHLIQDADTSKDNYGIVSQRPERVDINFLNHNTEDWLHINGVDYNAEFDQIIMSVHNFSEFWIIDHSTTTAQAADSIGGIYGQGGDILYRWGNAQAYDQGTTNDQKLFLQHHTHWISDSLPDAGKILLFNNQAGTLQNLDYSTVNIVNPPVDANGFYSYSGGAYNPANFDWTYMAPNPTDFFSNIISGAQRLENGNTLICEGVTGRFFEVDTNINIVWEYINPVNSLGPMTQGTIPANNNVFRCERYARDYPAFDGKTLIPQGYIEIGSTFSCDLYTAIEKPSENSIPNKFVLDQNYPNPFNPSTTISFYLPIKSKIELKIYDINGREVQILVEDTRDIGYHTVNFNATNLASGIYYYVLKSEKFVAKRKMLFIK